VDGASSDGTLDWLEALNDERVTWRSEPDAGIYDAMNKGIDRTRGEIVVFLNSADRFAGPQTLSFVDFHQQSSHWSWAVGTMNVVSTDGRVIDTSGPNVFRPWSLRMGYQSLGHQAAYFTADMVRSLGHYRVQFGVEADQEFMIRALDLDPPNVLHAVVAIALAGGVSFGGTPDAFVLRAREIRRDHQTLLGGNPFIDSLATDLLRAEKRVRHRLWRMRGGRLSA